MTYNVFGGTLNPAQPMLAETVIKLMIRVDVCVQLLSASAQSWMNPLLTTSSNVPTELFPSHEMYFPSVFRIRHSQTPLTT